MTNYAILLDAKIGTAKRTDSLSCAPIRELFTHAHTIMRMSSLPGVDLPLRNHLPVGSVAIWVRIFRPVDSNSNNKKTPSASPVSFTKNQKTKIRAYNKQKPRLVTRTLRTGLASRDREKGIENGIVPLCCTPLTASYRRKMKKKFKGD